MATLKTYVPIDMTGESAEPDEGTVVQYNSTRIVIAYEDYTEFYYGKNFTYDDFGPTGGTFTSYEAKADGGTVLAMDGFSIPLTDAASYLVTGDFDTLFQKMFAKADHIVGSTYDDVLLGFSGDDTVTGRGDEDTIFGMSGNDMLDGGNGADFLNGGRDNDTLTGAQGGDTIYGGPGQDHMEGGTGVDRFLYVKVGDSGPMVSERDVITGFQSRVDKIDLSQIGDLSFGRAGVGTVHAVQNGDDTVVLINTSAAVGAEMKIVLSDFTATALTAGDFIL